MSKIEVSALVSSNEVWKALDTKEKIDFFLDCWKSLSGSLKAHILSKFSIDDEKLMENELLMRKHEKELY